MSDKEEITLHNVAPVISMHDKFVDSVIGVIENSTGQSATEYVARAFLQKTMSDDESISLKALSKLSDLVGLWNSAPIINIKSSLPDMSDADSLSDF